MSGGDGVGDKRRTSPSLPVVFEPEFVTGLKKIFEEMIVFNQTLGLKIRILEPEQVVGRITMRHELVGHYSYNRLHGGVISAGLDAMGGLAVMAAIGARHMDEPPEQRLLRFAKLGTIDLRVDYLRPGRPETLVCEGVAVRVGRSVGVADLRVFHRSAPDDTIATGKGVYAIKSPRPSKAVV